MFFGILLLQNGTKKKRLKEIYRLSLGGGVQELSNNKTSLWRKISQRLSNNFLGLSAFSIFASTFSYFLRPLNSCFGPLTSSRKASFFERSSLHPNPDRFLDVIVGSWTFVYFFPNLSDPQHKCTPMTHNYSRKIYVCYVFFPSMKD